MADSTFIKRRIDVTFTLQPYVDEATKEAKTPTFSTTGKNQLTLSGYRTACTIAKQGEMMAECNLRVFGMDLVIMNDLSTMGRLPLAVQNNTMAISVGDDVNGMAYAYIGNIASAFADMAGMPDVAFQAVGVNSRFAAVNPVEPTSYTGNTDVATIMRSLATQMDKTFENNGVSVRLASPYLWGTALQQAEQCVQAAGIGWNHGDNGVVAIWPRGGERAGSVPVISPDTGLVGYPTYTRNGIALTTLYNPNIGFGSLIEVRSSLKPATGKWRVGVLQHHLSAEMPGGPWFTYLEANDPAFAPIYSR